MNNEQQTLKRIKEIVLKQVPGAKVYLYGSRARGEAKQTSDWDLLILLSNDKITIDMERNVTYPLYDLEFEIGEVISPLVYSEKEWNEKYKVTPFYAAVMQEGKLL